jgi:hypothetical protein
MRRRESTRREPRSPTSPTCNSCPPSFASRMTCSRNFSPKTEVQPQKGAKSTKKQSFRWKRPGRFYPANPWPHPLLFASSAPFCGDSISEFRFNPPAFSQTIQRGFSRRAASGLSSSGSFLVDGGIEPTAKLFASRQECDGLTRSLPHRDELRHKTTVKCQREFECVRGREVQRLSR